MKLRWEKTDEDPDAAQAHGSAERAPVTPPYGYGGRVPYMWGVYSHAQEKAEGKHGRYEK